MTTTFPCVYLHILDAILTLFAPVMHCQSCLPSGLTVAVPDAFSRIPSVFLCCHKLKDSTVFRYNLRKNIN